MDHEREVTHEECSKSDKKKDTPYYLEYLRFTVNMVSISITSES